MPSCPSCGERNPERARFCLACGTPLLAGPARRETRKTVTVLFCDQADSTVRGERVDPEPLRRMMSRYYDEMRSVIDRHGGTVEKFIGDAVMAVFGTPTVHEDDALRAVRAAVEMREALAGLNRELERDLGLEISIRIGVNTGEVVTGDTATGHAFVTGDSVNVASRLETAASSGEILIGDATYRLVRNAVLVEPVEALELKGKEQTVTAWRLLAVLAGAPPLARHPELPLVGRKRELSLLGQAFERAADDRTCHLFTLLGPAGAGKSRLANELIWTLDDEATVLLGRCLPYGEGITFWPVADVVKRAAALAPGLSADQMTARFHSVLGAEPRADEIARRLLALVGASDERVSTADTFWAVRKLLEAVARGRPVLVVFDDVQWGEPTFLDLVEHVAEWARDAPILILCLARPELLEERTGWSGGKLNATSLLLEPLDAAACSRLIDNLLDRAEVAEDVKARVATAAEGNPLFVEEMLAMLIDDGTLKREGERWIATRDVAAIEMPPTIQALLAARLDRLEDGEQRVIEYAAVAGKLFSRAAVLALAGGERPPELDEHLASLVRKQLIRPHRAQFGRDDTYRFRHILIRDAAYQAMSKDIRAELHERFANWLEHAGAAHPDLEEIIGYHLEQAHRFRSDLGLADEAAETLARRASNHLASAGREAFERSDMPAAVTLLTRSTVLLRDDDESRLEVAPDLGKALMETGEIVRAEAVLSRAVESAEALGNRRLAALAALERSFLSRYSERARSPDEIKRSVESLVAVFQELGDELGIAKALRLVALEHWIHGSLGAMEGVLDQALEHARASGDDREVANVLVGLARGALLGPMPVAEALDRCGRMRVEAAGDRSLEAFLEAIIAGLEALRGHFAEARELYSRSRATFEDLGLDVQLASLRLYAGIIELLAGDPVAAERELILGYQRFERMGERSRLSTEAAFLARAVYEQGRLDEAERYTSISETAASPDDVVSQVVWRQTRARVLADRGKLETAERLAREAVTLADKTDLLTLRGDALLALADILQKARHDSEAERFAEVALQLYEAKGDVVSAQRASALVSRHLDPARARE
jgi:class 3 adenylate cyclase/tetratricopeptide (TPR) repeat protein